MNIDELKAENARLKAEVEAQAKRWAESEDLISHYKQQMDEVINDCQCSRLKAEVERLELKATNLYNAMKVKMEADEVICKARAIIEANETAFNFVIKELQAEVERLTDENVTLRMERMQDETGKRITYADYARLKAEVERLTKDKNNADAYIRSLERQLAAKESKPNA